MLTLLIEMSLILTIGKIAVKTLIVSGHLRFLLSPFSPCFSSFSFFFFFFFLIFFPPFLLHSYIKLNYHTIWIPHTTIYSTDWETEVFNLFLRAQVKNSISSLKAIISMTLNKSFQIRGMLQVSTDFRFYTIREICRAVLHLLFMCSLIYMWYGIMTNIERFLL